MLELMIRLAIRKHLATANSPQIVHFVNQFCGAYLPPYQQKNKAIHIESNYVVKKTFYLSKINLQTSTHRRHFIIC